MPEGTSKIQRAARRRPGPGPGLGGHGDLGPGDRAVGEWTAAGLALPDVAEMRRHRLARLRAHLAAADVAGIVVVDPLNVRYATDSTNMQVWCLHNAVRYAFVATDGPVVLFDFHNCEHLSAHLDLVDEIRPGRGWFYFISGPRVAEHARAWADEIADLVRAHGGGNRRLAVDRLDPAGLDALRGAGIAVTDGQAIMETARAVKGPDEIRAMRCAVHACETAMQAMREALRPGLTEQELWAHLHAGNIARGGEWIETRLLASGPRTNPWFQECAARPIEAGDIVAFDTDLIGPYGMCVDISRSWLAGDGRPTDRQRALYDLAAEQIAANTALIRPGVTLRAFTDGAFRLPEAYRAQRYSVMAHGVGLCDEYPAVYYPEDFPANGYDAPLEPGMILSVESYVGEIGGPDGVKLEQQVLVTDGGVEALSTAPMDGLTA